MLSFSAGGQCHFSPVRTTAVTGRFDQLELININFVRNLARTQNELLQQLSSSESLKCRFKSDDHYISNQIVYGLHCLSNRRSLYLHSVIASLCGGLYSY